MKQIDLALRLEEERLALLESTLVEEVVTWMAQAILGVAEAMAEEDEDERQQP